ncbi:MAG: bifunctional pyr operon transcriptional regulator/uracil phosphoribosyltransferase PyrR [Sedimentisphaerales bacterium]|nr:bifunctional pyr operon transcriptional regulator/uracil phosphoribosyltransferase PyrR [Sedimentisphaerales bacterium]
MEVILKEHQISQLLEHLASQIIDTNPDCASIGLVGIRSRGEILAQRLQHILLDRGVPEVECGALDTTLYRDDINQMGTHQPTVQTTDIDFNIDDRVIILVDDVLNTGRSVRAALDALTDLGRPSVIRLAVLLDRGSRELPIGADYIGKKIEVPHDKTVQVYLNDMDEREEVVLE